MPLTVDLNDHIQVEATKKKGAPVSTPLLASALHRLYINLLANLAMTTSRMPASTRMPASAGVTASTIRMTTARGMAAAVTGSTVRTATIAPSAAAIARRAVDATAIAAVAAISTVASSTVASRRSRLRDGLPHVQLWTRITTTAAVAAGAGTSRVAGAGSCAIRVTTALAPARIRRAVTAATLGLTVARRRERLPTAAVRFAAASRGLRSAVCRLCLAHRALRTFRTRTAVARRGE